MVLAVSVIERISTIRYRISPMSYEEVLGFHAKPTTGLKALPPVLEARGISRVFEQVGERLTVLDSVSFSVEAGHSVAIVGPSGSGKTTLLGLCAGLDVPSAGDVLIDGTSISRCTDRERATLRNRKVGFVFQNFQLIPHLTALENVRIPLDLRGERSAASDARAWLERMGLGKRMHSLPGELSGGELQRVALARAFIGRPRILFADEPTGNLDDTTSDHIVHELFEINRATRTTLVIVTHDMGIARLADRTLHLKHGRLVE